jgi:hypothetical protein
MSKIPEFEHKTDDCSRLHCKLKSPCTKKSYALKCPDYEPFGPIGKLVADNYDLKEKLKNHGRNYK